MGSLTSKEEASKSQGGEMNRLRGKNLECFMKHKNVDLNYFKNILVQFSFFTPGSYSQFENKQHMISVL